MGKISLLFCSLLLLGAASKEHFLSIEVGEPTPLLLEPMEHVTVSRKGVLDISPKDPTHWEMVGMQRGFVSITFYPKMKGAPVKYFVEVKRKEELEKKDEKDGFLPPSACLVAKVRCFADRGLIEGALDDFHTFFHLEHLCREKPGCYFGVRLTPSGQEELKQGILSVLPAFYRVKVSAGGEVIVSRSCSEDEEKGSGHQEQVLQALLSAYAPTTNVKLSCEELFSYRDYQIKAKIILIEKNAAEELGLDQTVQADGILSTKPLQWNPQFISRIHAYVKENRAEILGEPSFLLKSGEEGEAKTGGEIGVFHEARDITSSSTQTLATLSWKEYGMDLKVRINPLSDEEAKIAYHFTLKSPSSSHEGSNEHLQSNMLKSHCRLTLGKAIVVGGITFKTSALKDQALPFFAKLPIIGPLFHLVFTHEGTTQLYLWLEANQI